MKEIRSLREERKHAPKIVLAELEGNCCVLKSYDNCPIWLRQTVGRLAINRESWALGKMQGSAHVPRLLARPKPWAMVTEYLGGAPLESVSKGDLDPKRLLEQARSLLRDLEKAGVAHGDLGHDHWQDFGRECNLIWTDDHRLVAIDFAGSLARRSSVPLLSQLGSLLAYHDQLLEAKVLYHFGNAEDMERLDHSQWPVEVWNLLRLLGKV